MSTAQVREQSEDLKQERLDLLNGLMSSVKGWVEGAGWRTSLTSKSMTEPDLGRFEVPLLLMERGEFEFVLSPLPSTMPSGGGIVDLYLMPAYDDVVSFSFEEGRWLIHDTFPLAKTGPRPLKGCGRFPLDEATFLRVLDAVPAHA